MMSENKPTTCDQCSRSFQSYRAMRVHQSRTGHMEKPWRNKERLEKMYVEKGMSAYEIADELGCGQNAVYNALQDFNIQVRDPGKTKRIQSASKPANFRTHQRDGYEESYTSAGGEGQFVRVHRLCAVAWFGLDEVKDSVVHHKKPIEWLNTPWNLEIKENQSEHAKEHDKNRERNSDGQYV